MRTAIRGAQFRRDVKLARRRGKDLNKLRDMILLLLQGDTLPPHYKDHRCKVAGTIIATATLSRTGC